MMIEFVIDAVTAPYHFGHMSNLFYQFVDNSFDPAAILLFVFLADAVMGDPAALYKRIPHPVVVIGNFISWFETRLNSEGKSNGSRFVLGAVTSLATLAVFCCLALLIEIFAKAIPMGWVIIILLSSSLVAYKGLFQAVNAVKNGLHVSLEEGRAAVSHIVGRDPETLDKAGIARAGVESLAENFLDGTVAPLFWFLILGFPGLVLYKSINTLDSMIGHRNDRFEYFGKFAARLDDVVNYIPARITGLLIVISAVIVPKASAGNALRCMISDASKHNSVNAGWPEAAMAGAINMSLAGPRQYGGVMNDSPWMNERGRKDVGADDMQKALSIYLAAGAVLIVIGIMLLTAILR